LFFPNRNGIIYTTINQSVRENKMPGYHIVWMVGFAALVIATGYVMGNRRQSRLLRALFIPGHLLFAGLQLLVCEVFRIEKEKAGVLDGKTGRQLHDLPPSKRWALNFGPFIAQFVVLATVLWLSGITVNHSCVEPPRGYALPAAAIWRFGHTLTDVISSSLQRIWDGFAHLVSSGNPATLLIIWVVVSFVVALVPQKGTGRYIIAGFVAAGLLVWGLSWIGFALHLQSRILQRLDGFMAAACGFAFWVFLVALVAFKLPQLLRRKRPQTATTPRVEKAQ